MPLVVVFNLSKNDFGEKERIEHIEIAIVHAIISIKELKLTINDVSFSFPQDPTVTSDKVLVTIIVELLFDRPERTFEVRQRLAQKIAEAFKSIPGNENRKVEVATRRFNPEEEGFYQSN